MARVAEVVIRLRDMASGPAGHIASKLREIGVAARSLNKLSYASIGGQIRKDVGEIHGAIKRIAAPVAPLAGGAGLLGLWKFHDDVYKFSLATNKLSAANPDFKPEQIRKIKDIARELTRESIFDPATIMNAANALARADVSITAIEGNLRPLVRAAMAADVPVNDLADDFVKLATGFDLSLKTKEDAKETFSYLADLAQYVSQKAPGTFNDFVQGVRMVAPSVRTLGVQIEWLAGAYIMLDKAGIRNAEAGTALRAFFKSLIQPTSGARAMLAQLGIDPNAYTKFSKDVKADQLVTRLANEYGKNFSKFGPRFQAVLDKGGTRAEMQAALTRAITQGWGGKLGPQDAKKVAKTVAAFLAAGAEAIDPEAYIKALADKGLTFGQFLQLGEPRQAQRLINLIKNSKEGSGILETPLSQVMDFRRGLADDAAGKMMSGYVGAIAKIRSSWHTFIEELDRGGVIDKIASGIESLGKSITAVVQGTANWKDWLTSLSVIGPILAPIVAAVTDIASALFKMLSAIPRIAVALGTLILPGEQLAAVLTKIAGPAATILALVQGVNELVKAGRARGDKTPGEFAKENRGGKSPRELARERVGEMPGGDVPDEQLRKESEAAAAGAATGRAWGDALMQEIMRAIGEATGAINGLINKMNFHASPTITPTVRGINYGPAPASPAPSTRSAQLGGYNDFRNRA